ncbi:hypothetical protein, partial [Fischerella muscicola]|uniref:hypothetical protein n=1 Tax=Fischerella muscicola TaxID=92938 RepID=UPI001CA5C3FD
LIGWPDPRLFKKVGDLTLQKSQNLCGRVLQQNTQACAFYERHGFKAGKQGINQINNQPNIEYHWRDR